MLLAYVQACLFMQHCELFWNPSCTDFMKPKSAVDLFIGRTMTNLQMICHSISNHLSSRTMSRAHSLLSSFVAVDRRLDSSSCVTFVQPFFLIFPSVVDSAAAHHCSCIVLKVFARSVNVALLWCKQKEQQPSLIARPRRWN
jgi:hypothetical protein